MKTGLVSISFRELGIEEIVRLVSEAKLDGIEWGGDVHVPHGDLLLAEQAKRITIDAGLQVSAYGSYYRYGDCLDGNAKTGPSWEAVLDSAEALGTPMIRVWAGELGSGEASENGWKTVVDRTRVIADSAAKRKIQIGFEFHGNTLTDTNASTRKLLDDINHPNVSTFWQPYMSVEHSYRMEGLRDLVDSIENVHCNHFAKEGWPHALFLEDGMDCWKDFLGVLEKADPDRWISIEHVKDNVVESFLQDAATLRKLVKG